MDPARITNAGDSFALLRGLERGLTAVKQKDKNRILPESSETNKEKATALAQDILALSRVSGSRILSEADRDFTQGLAQRISDKGYSPTRSDVKKLTTLMEHAIAFLNHKDQEGHSHESVEVAKRDHDQRDKTTFQVTGKFEAFQDWLGLQSEALKQVKTPEQVGAFREYFMGTVDNLARGLKELQGNCGSTAYKELLQAQIKKFLDLKPGEDTAKLHKNLDNLAKDGRISRSEVQILREVGRAIDGAVAGIRQAQKVQGGRFLDVIWSGDKGAGTLGQGAQPPRVMAELGLDQQQALQKLKDRIRDVRTPADGEALYLEIQQTRQSLLNSLDALGTRYLEGNTSTSVVHWLDLQVALVANSAPTGVGIAPQYPQWQKVQQECQQELEADKKAGKIPAREFNLMMELGEAVTANIQRYQEVYRKLEEREDKLAQPSAGGDKMFDTNKKIRLARAELGEPEGTLHFLDKQAQVNLRQAKSRWKKADELLMRDRQLNWQQKRDLMNEKEFALAAIDRAQSRSSYHQLFRDTKQPGSFDNLEANLEKQLTLKWLPDKEMANLPTSELNTMATGLRETMSDLTEAYKAHEDLLKQRLEITPDAKEKQDTQKQLDALAKRVKDQTLEKKAGWLWENMQLLISSQELLNERYKSLLKTHPSLAENAQKLNQRLLEDMACKDMNERTRFNNLMLTLVIKIDDSKLKLNAESVSALLYKQLPTYYESTRQEPKDKSLNDTLQKLMDDHIQAAVKTMEQLEREKQQQKV